MKALAIAGAAARRLVRDRTAVFFIVVLPIVIIVIVGAVARGFNTFRIGLVQQGTTASARAVAADLAHTPGLSILAYPTRSALEAAIARSQVSAGVIVPSGLSAAERSGGTAAIAVVAEHASSTQQAAAARVSAVITAYGGRVQAAQFAAAHGASYDSAAAAAESLYRTVPQATLRPTVVAAAQETLPAGYEYSAPTELVLFVFLSAVAGGATIVESRRIGMFERMSAAPVRPRTIVLGESLTYVGIALGQSLLIVGVGALFGVSWGDPLAAVALVLVWCFVGAGAGMVAGTLFRTPEQASAVGPVVGITFAMLGGCMWPLSIVSSTMREVGHATPHAWAVDAWTALIAAHGDLVSIGRELGVLALFALAFFATATVRLRRAVAARSA